MRFASTNNNVIRNNIGGYYNHKLFWEVLNPSNAGVLSGPLKVAIDAEFGSFSNFKDSFSSAAGSRFGSGWAWLGVKADNKLCVCSTPNQDNPLMGDATCPCTPILGLDVWEHAYYLRYQNRRSDYVNAFFSVVNWNVVEAKYDAAIAANNSTTQPN